MILAKRSCLLGCVVLVGISAAIHAAPTVEPVTQVTPLKGANRENAIAVGAELRRLANAGRMDEYAALGEAVRQYPRADAAWLIEVGREIHTLGKTSDDADGIVAGREFGSIRSSLSAVRSFPPAIRLPADRLEFRPMPAFEGLARWSAIHAAEQRRVKIRSVRRSVGALTQPILYPPFFWLPMNMIEREIEAMDPTLRPDLEDGLNRHSEILLLGLNVKLFPPKDAECCAPNATLDVALSDDSQVERFVFDVQERERGVYYLTDPVGASVELVGALVTLSEYPLLTINGLSDVDYPVADQLEPISYAVRWREFELEYGAHVPGDPESVIR